MACISPFFVYHGDEWLPLPCGRCPPCKKSRVDGWVFRMLQQERVSTSAHFVTLTYDPQFLPISENGHMTLDKGAFPRYMKRLRKLCPDFKLSYYACGEYGTDNSRPHYHAIVFNVPDDSLFFQAWALGGVNLGIVHVGQVSGDSIAYTVGYINKRSLGRARRHDDRVPEFSLMSKGLGANYVTSAVRKFHTADLERNFLTKDGGSIIAMPRYYRERIFSEDERADQRRFSQMATGKVNSLRYADFLSKYGDHPTYTIDRYLEDIKLGIVDSFYSSPSQTRKL